MTGTDLSPIAPSPDERPLERLLGALPHRVQRAIARLRQPGAKWLRLPLAILLIVGGLLGFLPVLGFWMVPVGLVLLGEDIPPLKRVTLRALGAMQSWWDRRGSRR